MQLNTSIKLINFNIGLEDGSKQLNTSTQNYIIPTQLKI